MPVGKLIFPQMNLRRLSSDRFWSQIQSYDKILRSFGWQSNHISKWVLNIKRVFLQFIIIDLCCSNCYLCIASLSPVQLRATQSKLSIHFIQSESKLSKRFILPRFQLKFDLSNSTLVQTVVELSRRFDRQISEFGQKIADKKCG
jgi:uncharacterized protein (UPF0212 family)